MANTTQWNDIGHIGRALMRNFKFSETMIKKEMKSKKFDQESYLHYANDMASTGMKLSSIIKLFDIQPRIKNIERIIGAIPPQVLAETKARIGL